MQICKAVSLILLLMILLSACSNKERDEKLRIGLIRPSINHLPLSFALSTEPKEAKQLTIHYFSSGWEVQEAMIGGKIDTAIMPFSYAFNAAVKGYPIKIASFLERETDAIVTARSCTELRELNGKKLGLLKASTLDLLTRQLADSLGIKYLPIYFRSPNELVAALQRSEVDAITIYEPLIGKLDTRFHALHYFGESYPLHPCCDIVVNTEQMNAAKQEIFAALLLLIESGIQALYSPQALAFVMKTYDLDEAQASSALAHTGFQTGLDQEGIAFELMMMESAMQLGYTERIPAPSEIYQQ
jgi:ABC-type nitrate/sulfonate/bicarbonate transport system substrate-binding protein